jgi:hypothetical protein
MFGSCFPEKEKEKKKTVSKIAKCVSILLMYIWQTVLKTKIIENKNTKNQKYGNN